MILRAHHPAPPHMAARARRVVANPDPADSTSLRLWAFAVLKAERGQSLRQHVLQRRSRLNERMLQIEAEFLQAALRL